MRHKIILCVILQSLWSMIFADTCALPEYERIDCGWPGIRSQTCTNIGCCFQVPKGNSPWCYYPTDFPFPMVPRLNPRDAGLLTGEPDKCRLVNYASRDNCGYPRITSSACQSRGCCFDSEQQRFAWCFYPQGYFKSDGKVSQKFSGSVVLSRVFDSKLGDNSSNAFHAYAPVVDWQLLKSLRYKIPSVKSVFVHTFTEQAGYTQAHFIVETLSSQPNKLSPRQLTDSSVEAIRTRLIGVVDYTMFINVPLLKDYDECLTTSCPVNSLCQNTMGSFTCSCEVGYIGDGFTRCDDVNECDVITGGCHDNATCTNTEGSFFCTCKDGFTGDGKVLCKPTTEDSIDPIGAVCDPVKGYTPVYRDFPSQGVRCSPDAGCEFDGGRYTCDCDDGFIGDGEVCDDVDECESDKHGCHDNATCYNEKGGYNCSCDLGFSGDGFRCDDVNECEDDDICDVNSKCENTNGDYECKCHVGFVEDENDEKVCIEQTILYGEVPIVEAVSTLLGPSTSLSSTFVEFVEKQLEIFYSQLLQPDVDVEFVKLENNATVVGHAITLTGASSHNITAAGFNESLLAAFLSLKNRSLENPPVVAAPFLSLQVIKPEKYKEFISRLPDSSELKESLKEQLAEQQPDANYRAVAVASIRINPASLKFYNRTNSTDFLKSESSKDFRLKVERDLYLTYSRYAPQVKNVKVIQFRPDRRFDANNIPTAGDRFSVDFEANLTLRNDVVLPEPESLDYSLLAASLEAELRKSYSLLLDLVFHKIDRITNPDVGNDEDEDEYGSGGSGSGDPGLKNYGKYDVDDNDDDADDNDDDDFKKQLELLSSNIKVRVTNITKSSSANSSVVQHSVSFRFPSSTKSCKDVLLTALTSITSSNTTDISLVFDSSPSILRNISTSAFSSSCNATVEKAVILWGLTSDELRLLYGISKLLTPQDSKFADMPAAVVLTRRPMVVDLVQYLYKETNETWRKQNEPKCGYSCLVADHLIQLESNDDVDTELLLKSFHKSVTGSDFNISSQSFLGIPFDVDVIDGFPPKDGADKKQGKLETKTFSALVDLTSSRIADLFRTLTSDSVTYKAVLVFLETNLESVYKNAARNQRSELLPDIKDFEVELIQLRIVTDQTRLSESVVLRHLVTVLGGNLTRFDAEALMLIFSTGVLGTERNMFSRNLQNATLLSYNKPQRKVCDPHLGWTLGSADVGGCSEDAECVRSGSSLFRCTCEDGYAGDGFNCSDVDECKDDLHGCSVFAECENEKGGYDCECEDGFDGDGFSCDDVDECELDRDDCHDNATCTNAIGGFQCICGEGFAGNGKNCAEQSFFYGLIPLNSSFTYISQLSNSSSEVFRFLSEVATSKLTPMYKYNSNLNATVAVTAFLEGSVFVEHIVTLVGGGAYNVDAPTLNQTFMDAAVAFPLEFKMFSSPLRSLNKITTDGIESVLDFRGREDLLTGVLGPVKTTEEARCLTAGILINTDVYKQLSADNSCSASPEFTAKLQRNLFNLYSRVYPNIMQVRLETLLPASVLTELANPVTKRDVSVVFSGSILVSNLHNYTWNSSSTQKQILRTLLEAELRFVYFESLKFLLKNDEACVASGRYNESDACSDGCKQILLTVRVTDLRNTSDTLQPGVMTAEHQVIIQFPTVNTYCAYILNVTGITFFAPTDVNLVRSIEEIVTANISQPGQKCADLLQRVFTIRNLTPADLRQNFTVALLNAEARRFIYTPPSNLTKVNSPQVNLKALVPTPERLLNVTGRCHDMIAYHSVVYTSPADNEFNSYVEVSSILAAFVNDSSDSSSYTGLPFDLNTRKFNLSLLNATLKSSTNPVLSLARLKSLGPPTFTLGPISKFVSVPYTNGQAPQFNALANDLKVAASFLLAARSFNIEITSDLLSVLEGLRTPVRSLILSILSSSSDYAKLGLQPYVGELLVAAIELNL